MSKCGAHQAIIISVFFLVIGVVIIILGVITTAGTGGKYERMIIAGSSISAFGLLILIICIAVNSLPTDLPSKSPITAQSAVGNNGLNAAGIYQQVDLGSSADARGGQYYEQHHRLQSSLSRVSTDRLSNCGSSHDICNHAHTSGISRSPNLQVHIQLSPAQSIRSGSSQSHVSFQAVSPTDPDYAAEFPRSASFSHSRKPGSCQLSTGATCVGIGRSTSATSSLLNINHHQRRYSEHQHPHFNHSNRIPARSCQDIINHPSAPPAEVSRRRELSQPNLVNHEYDYLIHNASTNANNNNFIQTNERNNLLMISSPGGSSRSLAGLSGGVSRKRISSQRSSRSVTAETGSRTTRSSSNLCHDHNGHLDSHRQSQRSLNVRRGSNVSINVPQQQTSGGRESQLLSSHSSASQLPSYSECRNSSTRLNLDSINRSYTDPSAANHEQFGPPPSYESVVKGPSLFHTSV